MSLVWNLADSLENSTARTSKEFGSVSSSGELSGGIGKKLGRRQTALKTRSNETAFSRIPTPSAFKKPVFKVPAVPLPSRKKSMKTKTKDSIDRLSELEDQEPERMPFCYVPEDDMVNLLMCPEEDRLTKEDFVRIQNFSLYGNSRAKSPEPPDPSLYHLPDSFLKDCLPKFELNLMEDLDEVIPLEDLE